MSSDTYSNFSDLRSAHSTGHTIEFDLSKNSKNENECEILFLAPHGGAIETHTTAITKHVSKELGDVSYFSFIGQLPSNNRILHITSVNYDEPTLCLEILPKIDVVIAIHGTGDSPTESIFYVGGLMRNIAKLLVDKILPSKGFQAVFCEERFAAIQPENICNRGRFKKGIQFEMTRKLRQELVEDFSRRSAFCEAMKMLVKYLRGNNNSEDF